MWCLKYQSAFVLYLRPDYDSIPFLKIYLGTYQKRQKTSVKCRKCGFNRQNVVIFWGFAPDPQDSALWNNQKWKETNETYSKCCVSSISVRSTCHMPSASAGLRPYLNHKGYAPEFVR